MSATTRFPLRRVIARVLPPGRGILQVPGYGMVYFDGPDARIDTLECGHKVTRYTDATSRRCPECGPSKTQPAEDPGPLSPTAPPPPNAHAHARGKG